MGSDLPIQIFKGKACASRELVMKKRLIEAFDKIINKTIQGIGNSEGDTICIDKEQLVFILMDLRAFAKTLVEIIPSYLDKLYEEDGVCIDIILSGKTVRQRVEEVQMDIVDKTLEVMKNIDSVLQERVTKEEAFDAICINEVRIAFLLRFDLPYAYSFNGNYDDITVGKMMRRLKEIGFEQGDFYTLNDYYCCSNKKILPVFHENDVALVMQGPIDNEGNFTLETLLMYRRIYPFIPIILSTWEGEISDFFRFMASGADIKIVESKLPIDKGYLNIKLQLLSTNRGLDICERLENVKYVLKTRTDQRFFLPEFIICLKNMVREYKSKGRGVKERIVFLEARNTKLLSPFVISDFMSFGTISDLRHLYNASGEHKLLGNVDGISKEELQQIKLQLAFRENADIIYNLSDEVQEKANQLALCELSPESYIARIFYENYIINRELGIDDNILAHYWQFLREKVIIADSRQLMLYWNKYIDKYYTVNGLNSDSYLTASTWFNLYGLDFD